MLFNLLMLQVFDLSTSSFSLNWHLLDNFHCFNANGTNPIEQVNHLFFVVSKFISIEEFGDRRIFGFLFFVLVEYPF